MRHLLNVLLAVLVLCVLALSVSPNADAANRKVRRTRSVSKAPQDKRIYLVHADVLRYDRYLTNNAQVLN